MLIDNLIFVHPTVQTPLMGKELSFTVDMSNVGCHCNAVASFLAMPGDIGYGDYYCDTWGENK